MKAIAQLVAQQERSADGVLNVSTDRFVLAFKDGTDDLKRLKKIAERVAPPADVSKEETRARLEILRSEPDKEVFQRFEKVIEYLKSRPATWNEIVALLRLSMFWPIAEGITHRIDIDPGSQLRSILADGQSSENAINALSRQMLALAAAAAGVNAEGLRAFLISNGFQLQAAPNYARDVQRVSEGTEDFVTNMRRLQRPIFGETIDRGVVTSLLRKLETGPTIVVGERGVGKSNVLLEMYNELRHQERHVVVCDLKQATPQHLLTSPTREVLANSIAAVFMSFPDPRPAYLLIDGLEETTQDAALERTTLSLLSLACGDRDRWRVLVTCRESTLRGRWEWRTFFSISADRGHDTLESIRHLRLERLTQNQLAYALAKAPLELREAVLTDPSVREFLSLPEVLALLSDLPSEAQTPALFSTAILDSYWERRIGSPERASAVIRIAREQKARGTSFVAVSLLVQHGRVLNELQSDGVLVIAGDRVSFAHEPLVDYVHARFPDE